MIDRFINFLKKIFFKNKQKDDDVEQKIKDIESNDPFIYK
jgi:hypothetical protein